MWLVDSGTRCSFLSLFADRAVSGKCNFHSFPNSQLPERESHFKATQTRATNVFVRVYDSGRMVAVRSFLSNIHLIEKDMRQPPE